MPTPLLIPLALLLPGSLSAPSLAQDADGVEALPAGAERSPGGLVVERGAELAYTVPDHEVLEFQVIVDVAVLGETGLGSFELCAGTEEYRAGLAASEPGALGGKRIGWIRGRAGGSILNYTLEHTIETRILPQDWPRVIHRDAQEGSENRRHELMVGLRDGVPSSWYRRDRHCKDCERREHFVVGTWPFSSDHHCKKCKRGEHRVWRSPETQEVPADAVDMLSAIFLARAMVREGREEIRFPMLDKDRWWQTKLTLAGRRVIETPAGSFRCREVKLSPSVPEELADEEELAERFEGLFGIHGTLSIWLDERSGVPVEIVGLVPAGPLELDVALRLRAYEGTPSAFEPVE